MKLLKSETAITLMAVLTLATEGHAQEPSINIYSRSTNTAPRIVVRSKFDFEKQISLKMKSDPQLAAADVLIRTLSKIGMVDAQGVRISSGFDVDLANKLIVAFSGGVTLRAPRQNSLQGLWHESPGQK